MKKIEDLRILQNEDKAVLEEQVKSLLKEGWDLFKTECVFDQEKGKPLFTTVVVRYKDYSNELLLD